MNIRIEFKPYTAMRYATLGDWYADGYGAKIDVAIVSPDWRYQFLIALHELIESSLCEARGIPESEVLAFDKASDSHDPGAEPAAPYHKEHMFAEQIERMVAAEIGVDWAEYEAACEKAMT